MTKAAPKRLTQQERREEILKAASEVFFEQGYAAMNMDAVIRKSGGSKRNIYTEFGNKEGLFAALIRHTADQIKEPLINENGDSLRDILLNFSRNLIKTLMMPKVLALYRTVMSEGLQTPALAQTFFEIGPHRTVSRLARILEIEKEQKRLKDIDCDLAASQFVGMLRDNLHLGVVLKLRPAPGDQEIETVVTSATDIFLNGITS